ncbi:hypothetical protein [Marinilabilia salmonicolor]|uniref:hypothetical protein n=1 Tax=Marinilabilia salmonicolor TaxID=989 RepID=UPI00029AD803|nr:hypothetical protein [Marinilabilia salmonicolor]
MKHLPLFLFLFITVPVNAQITTKHHLGFSLGADPFLLARFYMEDDDDNDYDNDYSSEDETTSSVALAMYYKYKPHVKWEFDIGTKVAAITDYEVHYRTENTQADMEFGGTFSAFTAINYSTHNAFAKEGYTPFFAALETGWTAAPGNLTIHNQQTGDTEVIDNLSGSVYFEVRAGFKYGWDNNAAGLFLAVNNQFNTRTADRELRARGLRELPNIGPIILVGINYEFGLRKKEKRKRRKSKSEVTYPDWFQPGEKKH